MTLFQLTVAVVKVAISFERNVNAKQMLKAWCTNNERLKDGWKTNGECTENRL